MEYGSDRVKLRYLLDGVVSEIRKAGRPEVLRVLGGGREDTGRAVPPETPSGTMAGALYSDRCSCKLLSIFLGSNQHGL